MGLLDGAAWEKEYGYEKQPILITVSIMTFKNSGKYYDSWQTTVQVEKDEWYYIIKAIHLIKQGHTAPQRQFEWLIGIDDSRKDMYPVLLRNK